MKLKRGNKFKGRSTFKQKGIKVTGKWKPVEIDPNLFADDHLGGLVCFEELTDYKLVASSKIGDEKSRQRDGGNEEVAELLEEDDTIPKKKRKKKKNLGAEASHIDALKAEEAELDQEAKHEDTAISCDQDEDKKGCLTVLERKPVKKRRKRKLKQQQDSPSSDGLESAKSSKKARNWSAEVLSASSDQKVDTSAWKGLFVPKPVLQALSELGFSAPTPIQSLALPPAIRDGMDILGAAETGMISCYCSFLCPLVFCSPGCVFSTYTQAFHCSGKCW